MTTPEEEKEEEKNLARERIFEEEMGQVNILKPPIAVDKDFPKR